MHLLLANEFNRKMLLRMSRQLVKNCRVVIFHKSSVKENSVESSTFFRVKGLLRLHRV